MARLLFILILLSAVQVAVASDHTCGFPLEKGTQWIYEGSAAWTVNVNTVEKSTHVRWSTVVEDSICSSESCLALVRGFPNELAWYEPNQKSHLSILVCKQGKMYHLLSSDDEKAQEIFRHLQGDSSAVFSEHDLILDLPLRAGKIWGQDPRRDDQLYCWHVESLTERKLAVANKIGNSLRKVYEISYRTMPDHQVLEFAPGIGIIRYVYVHHGTVASTDVHLVAIKHSK
jgi:hypothetical protein